MFARCDHVWERMGAQCAEKSAPVRFKGIYRRAISRSTIQILECAPCASFRLCAIFNLHMFAMADLGIGFSELHPLENTHMSSVYVGKINLT